MATFRRGKKWVARIYDPRVQAQRYVGTYESQALAKRAERLALEEVEIDKRRDRGEETVGSFAGRWLDDYPRPEESTMLHYQERARKFVGEYGDRLLRDIDTRIARQFLKGQPSAQGTLRAMWSDAIYDGVASTNPFAQLRLKGSPGRKHIEIIRPEGVDDLVEAAGRVHGDWGATTFAAMILTASYAGLRPGELFELRWSDIDLGPPGRALIQRALQAKTKMVRETKNHQRRRIVLPNRCLEGLSSVPRQVADDRVFWTKAQVKPFNTPMLHYYWKPVRAFVGRPQMDFYELRHFCGSYFADRGATAQDIAQQLGHQDGGKLAMELYIHAFEENALARLDSAAAADG